MGRIALAPSPELVIIDHPEEFMAGVRILMFTTRSKEGGRQNNPDKQPGTKKYITRSIAEYEEKLVEMLVEMLPTQRIYSTVDRRDIDKGIREFKSRQLDADYYDEDSKNSFYIDIYNRWISCLQSPKAKATSYFLFDLDYDRDNDDVTPEDAVKMFDTIGVKVLHQYGTKNGHHIITEPFNPSLVPLKSSRNSMLLVAYYKDKEPKVTDGGEFEKPTIIEYNGRT